MKTLAKTLFSLLILAGFIYGMGSSSFFPSMRLLQDTQWAPSLLGPLWARRLVSFLWVFPVGLGFWGWKRVLRARLFSGIDGDAAGFMGLSLALSFFSLYVLGLALNGLLYRPLTSLFFIALLPAGWKEWREHPLCLPEPLRNKRALWLVLPLLLWGFEYLSGPLVWDAVLDHYRFAREVSRLHQTLFHWTNHTGDMPKASELILAGFWNLGGESLSKLSSVLPAFLTSWLFLLFAREWKGRGWVGVWIFWTCPFFLAIYSWGYAEGFLAFFEALSLFCFWKAVQGSGTRLWLWSTAFFLGFSLAVKYTAVLAVGAVGIIWAYEGLVRKKGLKPGPACVLAFALPLVPWLWKNWLAFGNPFYPLAVSLFPSPVGYSPGMEKALLADTGMPHWTGLGGLLRTLWDCFFTPSNAVNAAWTPLAAMSLPWARETLRKRQGRYLLAFSILFFTGWLLSSTSLRQASGGTVALILLAAMAWEEGFKKGTGARALFVVGAALSLWLCLSAQLTTTAPYASALGMEDNLARLRRNYSYDSDTYAAYRYIEDHSGPWDRVVAFAVFQAYPLRRITFVDFKWKRPIFLQWASECRTAAQLAERLREQGVTYFLYQRWEAGAMARVEKDFNLEGMPVSEYVRFWRYYMEPAAGYENSFVYRLRTKPLAAPRKLRWVPGLQEWEGKGIKSSDNLNHQGTKVTKNDKKKD